jgi:hypothetical protein
LPGQAVAFSSSDPGIRFGPTIYNRDGIYTATPTSSTVVGTPAITASASWAGQKVTGQAILTQTLSFAVNGVPTGARTLIACHGRGCPFTKHLTATGQTGMRNRCDDRAGPVFPAASAERRDTDHGRDHPP